jgi:hypothetical protein
MNEKVKVLAAWIIVIGALPTAFIYWKKLTGQTS